MTFLHVTQSECPFEMNGKKGGTAIDVVPMFYIGTFFIFESAPATGRNVCILVFCVDGSKNY